MRSDRCSWRTVPRACMAGRARRRRRPAASSLARHQPLRRPAAVGRARERAGDRAVVHQRREVSALAALPDDDARAGPDAARRLRDARAANSRTVTTFGRVPFALLRRAHLPDPCARGRLPAGRPAAMRPGCSASFPPGSRPATGLALPASMRCGWWCVVALYPLCRWFAALKQRRNDWWLSYL